MRFNVLTIVGLLLLVAGVAFLLGVGIPGRETVLEVGGLSASVETEREVPVLVSGALAVLGLAAVAVGQIAGRKT